MVEIDERIPDDAVLVDHVGSGNRQLPAIGGVHSGNVSVDLPVVVDQSFFHFVDQTELFGHLTSASGDLASNLELSLTSAQYPGREAFLEELIGKMSGSDKLPSIEEIERVWYELNREMVESGKVVSFNSEIAKPNGDKIEQKVVRVGTFNVVSEEGMYLQFVPSKGTLEELARQPVLDGRRVSRRHSPK